MKVLSVNAGSSSLKFQVYEMPEEKVLISGLFERIGIEGSQYTIIANGDKIKKEANLHNHEEAVRILTEELLAYKVVNSLEEIEAIGHRVVHGGDKYADSVIITEDVIKTVEELFELAPLHNPANLMGVKAFMAVIPNATSVAVFDTAFHQTMEAVDYLYSVPFEWYQELGVRKYGFHGTSHKFITGRMEELLGKKTVNIITCHLGNGASICAIKDSKSIDTSMGFTPNAGLMMGTRSGDVDLTLIPYVAKQTGKTFEQVFDDLNKKSGYLGISGVSSDARDIEDGIKAGNERCILAQDMYIKRVVEYIAKYYVLLGSVDAICFAGGIGEKAADTRRDIINKLGALGLKLDSEANNVRSVERLITTSDSLVKAYIIPTDEEVMIARDTYSFIK